MGENSEQTVIHPEFPLNFWLVSSPGEWENRWIQPEGIQMKDLINQARELMEWADEYGIDEIDLSNGEEKIRIARTGSAVLTNVRGNGSSPSPQVRKKPETDRASKPARESEASAGGFSIVSPMVGTFYRAASPESKSFKAVGDQVKAGDTVCIVEAMKVMNQIKAPKEGVVKRILVNNAEVVYKGQTLMEIG